MPALTRYYTAKPFARYISHLPLWLAYHYVWWVIAVGNPFKAAHLILFSPQIVTFSFYVFFQAFAVYTNLYFLVPRYLEKRAFLKYALSLGMIVLSAALFIVLGYYLSAYIFEIDLELVYGKGTNCFFFFFGEAFPSTVASTTLAMSMKLMNDRLQITDPAPAPIPDKSNSEFFFVKCGNRFEKIRLDEILFIQGMQNYVTIYTTHDKYMALLKMKTLEHDLHDSNFVRVHKSYIISAGKISGFEGNELLIGEHRIPVSRTYRKKVKSQLVDNDLWGK